MDVDEDEPWIARHAQSPDQARAKPSPASGIVAIFAGVMEGYYPPTSYLATRTRKGMHRALAGMRVVFAISPPRRARVVGGE